MLNFFRFQPKMSLLSAHRQAGCMNKLRSVSILAAMLFSPSARDVILATC